MLGSVDNKENIQIFLTKQEIQALSVGKIEGKIFNIKNFNKNFDLRLFVSDNVGMFNGVNILIDNHSYDVNIHKNHYHKLIKKGILFLIYDFSGLTISIYDKEAIEDLMLLSHADDLRDFASKNNIVIDA
jgi:hypothetical protein